MSSNPRVELAEGLKHCLWFRGPVLMDHLITLRHEVNQQKAERMPLDAHAESNDVSLDRRSGPLPPAG